MVCLNHLSWTDRLAFWLYRRWGVGETNEDCLKIIAASFYGARGPGRVWPDPKGGGFQAIFKARDEAKAKGLNPARWSDLKPFLPEWTVLITETNFTNSQCGNI